MRGKKRNEFEEDAQKAKKREKKKFLEAREIQNLKSKIKSRESKNKSKEKK